MDALRSAISKDVSLSVCVPDPEVKKTFFGTNASDANTVTLKVVFSLYSVALSVMNEV